TLSENGGVTRGICRVDEANSLQGIEETSNIVKTADGAGVESKDGSVVPVDADSLVSMNFWGFHPDFFNVLGQGFKEFLGGLSGEKLLKGEYLLPTIVDGLLQEGKANITVRKSEDRWFGVTYKEDVPEVISAIAGLIEAGAYPQKLWS
ncbi:MAG: nucleotidyltransferase, partial [Lachnospiraceae bacterium]|nr:nucleotidyltransferase [Lachnospiraceae bacterium]